MPFRVTKGVKQRDPLSPVNSYIIMEQLLRTRPQASAPNFNNQAIQAMASVDNLILLAKSPVGLNAMYGMALNAKSRKVVLLGHCEETGVDVNTTIKCNSRPGDSWTYFRFEFPA